MLIGDDAAMPLYEYDCKRCEKPFEKLVRSSADATQKMKCPNCGSTQTARKLSAFAAVAGGKGASDAPMPRGCGRCGGPNPCGAE